MFGGLTFKLVIYVHTRLAEDGYLWADFIQITHKSHIKKDKTNLNLIPFLMGRACLNMVQPIQVNRFSG